MRTLLELERNKISEEDVAISFEIVESFIIRRSYVFEEWGAGYQGVFKVMWDKTKGNPETLIDELNKSSRAIPNDRDFKRAIMGRSVNTSAPKIKYIALQYEMHLSKDIYLMVETYSTR